MSTCSVVHNIQEYWINFASWRKKGRKKKNTIHETAPITGSEWQRLKETSGNYPFQIPFSKQGQVAHSHFQLWLDYCGWRLQIISEQPVPIFDCSKSKNKQTKTFIMLTFTFLYSSLCPLPLVLWMGITEKSLALFSFSPCPLHQVFICCQLWTQSIYSQCWFAGLHRVSFN